MCVTFGCTLYPSGPTVSEISVFGAISVSKTSKMITLEPSGVGMAKWGGVFQKWVLQELREEKEVKRGCLEEVRFELSLIHSSQVSCWSTCSLGLWALTCSTSSRHQGEHKWLCWDPYAQMERRPTGLSLPLYTPLGRGRSWLGSQPSALYPDRRRLESMNMV